MKYLIAIFFLPLLILFKNSKKEFNRLLEQPYSYILIDTNHYSFSWDTGIDEYSIYIIGNTYKEDEISKLIKKINSIYESEKEYKQEQKKSKKQNGYSTMGSLSKYVKKRLNDELISRVEFNFFDKNEREKFSFLAKGEIVKEFFYNGKGFLLEKEIVDKKRYVLVKHYW